MDNKKIPYSNTETKNIPMEKLFLKAEDYLIIDISTPFVCDKCHNDLTFRKSKNYVTMLCGCGCRIFYPPKENGTRHSAFITKKEYKKVEK